MSTETSGGLFSSVASDVKNYNGNDPIRPWLQGIKKLRSCLPPHVLREKLPRFLQRCVQTFQSHRRYRNDSRYVGVWIQLMDFVDDPKALLRMMEENQIGTKRAAFYMAYAIFYEKKNNFAEAERMYHLGVQNLAEPASELQKAYEQFLSRLDLHKRRMAKTKERRVKLLSQAQAPHPHQRELKVSRRNSNGLECAEVGADNASIHNQRKLKKLDATRGYSSSDEPDHILTKNHVDISKEKSHLKGCHPSNHPQRETSDNNCQSLGCVSGKNPSPGSADVGNLLECDRKDDLSMRKSLSCSDDTVVVKFVGSAIIGESETEDACHQGLIDPTINMKEAMSTINNMFCEPLEIDFKVKRKPNQSNGAKKLDNGFEVFVDDDLDQVNFHNQKGNCSTINGPSTQSIGNHKPSNLSITNRKQLPVEQLKPSGEAFKILADDEDDELEAPENPDYLDMGLKSKGLKLPISFPKANAMQKPSCLYEDTVIRRFVGSTIHDEPEVENACHHGLVDPTVNLKQAMDDINSMFGEPIDFVRPRRSNKGENVVTCKQLDQGFSILADDDMEESPMGVVLPISSLNSASENDLFEPTICTKEAMADINAMFAIPMDA